MSLGLKIDKACLRTEQNLMLVPDIEFKVILAGLIWNKGEERKEVVLWEFITNREHLFNNRTTIKRIKWIASRFHYFNPVYHEINLRSFKIESKKSNLEILKVELTTCKRMITKISNSLENYENKERSKLLPYFDNPSYLIIKNKLGQYKIRLEKVILEINNFKL